jgi:hypothetical protein
MPGLVQDEITEINAAVDRRWRGIDPLLPEPGDLPEACRPNPLVAAGPDGRPDGLVPAAVDHLGGPPGFDPALTRTPAARHDRG